MVETGRFRKVPSGQTKRFKSPLGQAWFSDACERVAVPLALQFGYCQNGGCCFVGPLSAAAGAALTSRPLFRVVVVVVVVSFGQRDG